MSLRRGGQRIRYEIIDGEVFLRIILITHAETKKEPPRLLSETGRGQAADLAGMITGIMGGDFRIKNAVSSPAVRCIEVDGSSQIAYRGDSTGGNLQFVTAGWIDRRGRDAA